MKPVTSERLAKITERLETHVNDFSQSAIDQLRQLIQFAEYSMQQAEVGAAEKFIGVAERVIQQRDR